MWRSPRTDTRAHVLANAVSTDISRRWLFLALYENKVESNNNETGQSDIKTRIKMSTILTGICLKVSSDLN